MNNKLFSHAAILFLVIAFFTLNSCTKDDLKFETIQIAGVEFKPNYFTQDGEIIGIDADIAAKALQNAGFEYNMSMSDSWQSAYDATINESNKAVLTMAYTPERKDLFKWAGPTSQGMYGIVENGNSGFTYPLPIEECKLLPQIAVVRHWMETTTLEDLGFENLVYYETFNDALEAFMAGEIKFIASDFYHLLSELPSGYFTENLNAVTRYRTVYYYIAFSKDVSDVLVNNVQKAIENLIKDQSLVSVVKKYIPLMPADYIPGTIQLYSERSPPFGFVTGQEPNRKVEGSAVDIVNEIQTRTGHVNKINMSLWTDAYAVVQYLPNSALFRTTRTPEREEKFQWVGPISTSRTYFYTLASSELTIETLEQAKDLQSISTPNGWFTHEFLINNNFQNIVATARTPLEAFTQLINGDVQAFLMSDIDVIWHADANDIPMSNLTQHMEALNLKDYIAFSLSTPASTVQQWQNHLNSMKTDGTFETIWNKWFDGVPMP
jgi:polar amino acid transport system substrate-binding protein